MQVRIGLCKGRHEIVDNGITVEDFVFSEAIDSPHDFQQLYQTAHKRLETFFSDAKMIETEEIHLFVTGLTSALVATLQAYRDYPYAPPLILRHFDRDSSTYTSQHWDMATTGCGNEKCGCVE